jgi:ureidoglycolate hydrolase
MDREIVDIIAYPGEGYRPLVDCNGWRVAYLRYLEELYPTKIEKMERHMQTDEVFVLLSGEAILLSGGNETAVTDVDAMRMEPLKLYNVRRGAWHGVILSRDATILLVENTNTCPANSEYWPLSAAACNTFLREARKIRDWADL